MNGEWGISFRKLGIGQLVIRRLGTGRLGIRRLGIGRLGIWQLILKLLWISYLNNLNLLNLILVDRYYS